MWGTNLERCLSKNQHTQRKIIQSAAKRPESLKKPFLMVYYFLFITLKSTLNS